MGGTGRTNGRAHQQRDITPWRAHRPQENNLENKMERYLIVFVCLLAGMVFSAILAQVGNKFGPAAAFVLFCVVGSLIMALSKPVGDQQ